MLLFIIDWLWVCIWYRWKVGSLCLCRVNRWLLWMVNVIVELLVWFFVFLKKKKEWICRLLLFLKKCVDVLMFFSFGWVVRFWLSLDCTCSCLLLFGLIRLIYIVFIRGCDFLIFSWVSWLFFSWNVFSMIGIFNV